MLVRSVPLDGGTITSEELGGDSATALGSLLDAAPRAGLDLPCRSGDADLWFAEAPAELERAKALCTACRSRPSASPARSAGRSRGGSGAARSSSAGS